MAAMFLKSKNIKTSDPHRIVLYLTDKVDLKGVMIYCLIK